MSFDFQPDQAFAKRLDEGDPLSRFRARFHLPLRRDGSPVLYFAGNSLGLQPKEAAAAVQREIEDWATMGVEAHFEGRTPWYSYHEILREPLAALLGAGPSEVVAMNALTVNLHLMLVTFYRPTATRHKILMESSAFPSDTYAIRSQIRHHGFDPDQSVIVVGPREGEGAVRIDDLLETIERRGSEIAVVLIGGVNFFTGQLFDMKRIAATARERGAVVGYDLAHAVGNVPLEMHDWQVDFAVWCSYKYLNGGPGAVAGCFVHERHAGNVEAPRFAGWWGNDPERRFRMQLEPEFRARPTADGWQLSNPPILAMAPLRVSLAIFDEAGMGSLREKSRRLTAYLQYWLERAGDGRMRTLTPTDPEARGCQLSILVRDRPEELFRALRSAGVVGDYRPPDVIRIAPVPLYNTYHEVWRLGQLLAAGREEARNG
jgi:kynureninase